MPNKVCNIVVANLATTDKYFAHFELEMHSDNTGANRVAVMTAGGAWDAVNLRYQQNAIATFKNAILGNTYWFRFRVIDKAGNQGPWSTFISEVAGDTVAPSPTYSFTPSQNAGSVTIDCGPSGAPSDLDHYEGYANFTGTAPSATTPANLPNEVDAVFRLPISNKPSVYFWVRAVDTSGNKQAWTAGGPFANGSLDDVADGPGYSKTLGTRVNAGRPLIDFSEVIHANKSLDNVPDGTRAAWNSTTQKTAAVDTSGNLLLKNIASATPTTSDPSTTSSTYAVIPELTQNVTTKGNKVLIVGSVSAKCDPFSGTVNCDVGVFRNGVQISPTYHCIFANRASTTVGISWPICISFIDAPAAGTYTYDLRWRSSTGLTIINDAFGRGFQVVELG
jgi:predicted phage tail protein